MAEPGDTAITWATYHAALRDGGPRPLLLRALALGEPWPAGTVAVDLGCGTGGDTLELLNRGFEVVAVDAEAGALARVAERAAGSGGSDRLRTVQASFEALPALPAAGLVYAALSLPFCAPDHFDAMWGRVRAAVAPGGTLAVHLFGRHDSWATSRAATMTFHDRAGIDGLLDGLELRAIDELDQDGPAVSGPKHWHVFDVIARRPG